MPHFVSCLGDWVLVTDPSESTALAPGRSGSRLWAAAFIGGVLALAFSGCGPTVPAVDAGATDAGGDTMTLDAGQDASVAPLVVAGGRFLSPRQVAFRLRSTRATRVEVWLYSDATGSELQRAELQREGSTEWFSGVVELDSERDLVYYGYRAWGPNWPFDASWIPGSRAGFLSDVDGAGNRFNPNKLLADPYATELSHDPLTPQQLDATWFASGAENRTRDSATVAPKGILLRNPRAADFSQRPTRPFRDEIIYEAHVRGLTMNDTAIPEQLRGTYAGAALKAEELRELGVTAIEFLPVHETQNDTNDIRQGTEGDNYWGYMSLSYFAPERRYAHDKAPGGPTREFQEMVRSFHSAGIKVYIDVVFNHSGEGGTWDSTGLVASLLSWRGIDNAAYYQLASDPRFYFDNTGVGGNLNFSERIVRDMVVDSLAYWHHSMGVDGFRFDLASVLGNACTGACFRFDKLDGDNVLNRIPRELSVRPADGGAGVDLIAEPWAIGEGTYQVGNFPVGWAEWNGEFRDTIRAFQNQLGVAPLTPSRLAQAVSGSSALYQDDGRSPWHSVNFLSAHDGLTHADLYRCNGPSNRQPWPWGPSDGGSSENRSWDQNGAPAQQSQAARTGFALLMLSQGVPMLVGGDEYLRSLRCNNNPYNLDSEANWLHRMQGDESFRAFAKHVIAVRTSNAAFRPARHVTGQDSDTDGRPGIEWLTSSGQTANASYMQNRSAHFLAWRMDGDEHGEGAREVIVAYNADAQDVTWTIPAGRWNRLVDSSETELTGGEVTTSVVVRGRSLVVLVSG